MPASWFSPVVLAGCLLLGSGSILPGCGGTLIAPPKTDDADVTIEPGARVTIGHTRLTMAIPKPFKQGSDEAWVIKIDNQTVAVLRFARHKRPERDVDAWIDSLIASVEKGGRAGVLVNKPVTLGDLQGRLIGAEDLLGQQRSAVRMVVAPAEDGVWVASFFASAAIVHKHAKVLDQALLSLRVPEIRR